MKPTRFVCILALWLCSTSSFALEKSLLWKISKPGTSGYSYLFGTIHVICEQDYFWTPQMQACFDSSQAVCFEMNLDDPGLMTEAAMKLMDFSGKTLRDYLHSDSDYQLLRSFIHDSLKQDLSYAESLKPIGLYFLYTTLAIQSPCKGETRSYEMSLLQEAKSKGKTIEGLESLDDQLIAIESIPTDTIFATLVRAAKGMRDGNTETQSMIGAYKKQDIAALQKMLAQSGQIGNDAEMLRNLVDKRNQKWLAPMRRQMSEQVTFFAVGAGHLPGLISLLRREGYRLEPIR